MSRLVWLLLLLTACATTPVTPVASLQQVVDQQIASQAPNAQQEGPFLVGAGPKADFSVMLEKGKCYWFTAASDEPITSGMYKVEAKTRAEGSFVLGVYSVPAAP